MKLSELLRSIKEGDPFLREKLIMSANAADLMETHLLKLKVVYQATKHMMEKSQPFQWLNMDQGRWLIREVDKFERPQNEKFNIGHGPRNDDPGPSKA